MQRQIAIPVDKILKEEARNFSVEQALTFDLAINLKAVKALDLSA